MEEEQKNTESDSLEEELQPGKHTGLGEEVDKVLDEEYGNHVEENYGEILTPEEQRMYENKIKMLHLADKYNQVMGKGPGQGKKTDPHHLHEYGAALIGGSFVTLGFLYHETFFTFYIIGMLAVFSKSLELGNFKGDQKLFRLIRNHPVWYIAGGLLFTLMFLGAGYTLPTGFEVSLTGIVLHSLLGM